MNKKIVNIIGSMISLNPASKRHKQNNISFSVSHKKKREAVHRGVDEDKKSLSDKVVFLTSIIVFLILISSLVKSLQRIKIGDELIQKNEKKLAQMVEDNNRLQSQIEFTQSQEYVEKQLRDKLGLAKEGEMILVLPEEELVKKFSPQIPEEEKYVPKTNIQKWLDLFK